MEPYVDYTFDVTNLVVLGENTLEVNLWDIDAVFGPMTGWCNYSGIVRDVYLRQVPSIYVEDVFFHTAFEQEYTVAHAAAEIKVCGGDVPQGGSIVYICAGGSDWHFYHVDAVYNQRKSDFLYLYWYE